MSSSSSGERTARPPSVISTRWCAPRGVAAFREGRLPFLGIVDTVERVLGEHPAAAGNSLTLADVLDAETWARQRTHELVAASPSSPIGGSTS